jgi:hypothetical protein
MASATSFRNLKNSFALDILFLDVEGLFVLVEQDKTSREILDMMEEV